MKKSYFWLLSLLFVFSVVYLAITTPITPHEAKILYASDDIASKLMKWSNVHLPSFLGFLAFRLPFVILGFVTASLFYVLSRGYFQKVEDAYAATAIFMFLPGIITASSLVNVAILVFPLVILFVLLYEKGNFLFLPLIMLALFFVHEASIIFFISILIFSIRNRDTKLIVVSLFFVALFVYIAKGIDIGGRPSGHFLEIFGYYATIFSPLVFFYFFYAMYRIFLRGEKSLLWHISFTALTLSLLLSIRQRIYITDFGPYVMIAIILMLEIYNKSMRVRLPQFQKKYRISFGIAIVILVLSTSVMVFHKKLFYMSKNPDKHFAKRIYRPYLLAKELKRKGISCYDESYGRKRYQMLYYGIPHCDK